MKNRNLKNTDDWKTPNEFYDKLNNEFDFNFDPCPYQNDITKFDGLIIEWKERNFINPPYNRKLKEAFVEKGIQESKKGKLCVFLLPVSTSTKLFHDMILLENPEIRFVKGRLKFAGINTFGKYVTNNCGMHDSMIVIFDGIKNNYHMRQGCKIIDLGEKTAIMCGGEPIDHKCNEDLNLLILENGDRIKNTPENYEKHFIDVRGGSVACSICGRAAIDNSMWMDFYCI